MVLDIQVVDVENKFIEILENPEIYPLKRNIGNPTKYR